MVGARLRCGKCACNERNDKNTKHSFIVSFKTKKRKKKGNNKKKNFDSPAGVELVALLVRSLIDCAVSASLDFSGKNKLLENVIN